MKIVVTGATGFVGRHLVPELLAHGHSVLAVAKDMERGKSMPWFEQVEFISMDLHDPLLEPESFLRVPDALVHLAWPGLPNYKDLFHYEQNLPAAYRFIKKMVAAGVQQVLVTGTCFEYGMQSGPLSEDLPTLPETSYGLAKDTLRKFLQELQKDYPFTLQWVRLFYMYGEGQNPNSLLAQLAHAIEQGHEVFNMSSGEQLRDYLPVEEVVRRLALLVEEPDINGIINCCSGKPISVRRLVEESVKKRKSSIRLNLGYYPYPDYEPMAFWGDAPKLNTLLEKA
ncbi:NAD(P)-dependent oxidoreductase [Desulfohalobiaceae bacterium Ax17]|uniref:NAD-dependent epimerase/dehydratase family protein n=1 Tax=Desulfovulcanus ferrireducens TaxID=2831190 RepID=UPI00207BBB19|nr:NAD(P)-dependent oxidoreductase [Desulfovulcanus ferrireducens]MBT8763357.1 NAD(P)-dependent oxidoreductase [Desulfovulcanus ferrireducens]